jgi:hypothetical protein
MHRRIVLLIAAVAISGAAAPLATATDYAKLSALGQTFAMRGEGIRCDTAQNDANLATAWGYTYMTWDYAIVDQPLCDAVQAMIDGGPFEDWQAALGVLVIVHESYHVRLWPGRANEALVECRAIRHWTIAMRLLGIDEPTIARLKPWALAMHWRIAALAPEYNEHGCNVPNPY